MRLRCGVGMLWSHLALEAKKFVSRGNRAGLHTLLSNLSRGMSETGLDLKSAWADFMAAGICSDSRVGGSDMCILPMTRLRGLGWVSPGAGGEGARAKVDGPVHVVAGLGAPEAELEAIGLMLSWCRQALALAMAC
jgi:hypothetical protein